jgi:hypothetical protein
LQLGYLLKHLVEIVSGISRDTGLEDEEDDMKTPKHIRCRQIPYRFHVRCPQIQNIAVLDSHVSGQ